MATTALERGPGTSTGYEPRTVHVALGAIALGAAAAVWGPMLALALTAIAVLGWLWLRRPGLLLAAYLLIPFYKGSVDPYLPIDVTVVLAILLAGQLVFVVRPGYRLPFNRPALVLWAAIGLLVAIGTVYAPDQQLAVEHAAYWWALAAVPLLAAVRVANEPDGVRDLCYGMFGLGVLVVLLGLLQIPENVRVSVLGTNTIGVGRAAALVPLIGLVLFRRGPRLAQLGLVLLIPAAFVVEIGSGSRGPLLALVVVAGLVALRNLLLGRLPSSRLLLASLIGLMLIGLTALVALPSLSILATDRFALLGDFIQSGVGGNLNVAGDTSSGTRVKLFELAVQMFANQPIVGYGTAGFEALALHELSALDYNEYPHNTLLQFAAEFGIVGVVAFLAFTALALANRRPSQPAWSALYLTFVFFLVNAMVSGDIYTDRMTWGLALLILCAPGESAPTAEPGDAEVPRSTPRKRRRDSATT
jgi:hypothetical protein